VLLGLLVAAQIVHLGHLLNKLVGLAQLILKLFQLVAIQGLLSRIQYNLLLCFFPSLVFEISKHFFDVFDSQSIV